MTAAPVVSVNNIVDQILNNKLDFIPAQFPEPVNIKPSSYVLIKASSPEVDENETESDTEPENQLIRPQKDNAEKSRFSSDSKDINVIKEHNSKSRINKSWSESLSKSPAGLQNHSVTCYMNSAMQAFFHIPAMAHYLDEVFQGKHKDTISSRSVTTELATLYHRVLNQTKRRSIYPSRMVRRLKDINFFMSHMEQEDAHEYYMSLMSKLQEDSVPKGKKLNTSILHDIFGGNLDQKVTCQTCGHISTTNQDFYDIPVSFTKPVKRSGMVHYNLEDSLSDFFSPELIKVDRKAKSGYTCEKCKTLTTAIKTNFIREAPEYLTIHIKRFKFQGSISQKIKDPMSYPLDLDLTKYIVDKKNASPVKYELITVISHSGRTASSGHYVALCRQPDGSWAEYDDELVQKIKKEQLQDDSAYMLIYAKVSSNPLHSIEKKENKKRSVSEGTDIDRPAKKQHVPLKPVLDEIDDIFAKKPRSA